MEDPCMVAAKPSSLSVISCPAAVHRHGTAARQSSAGKEQGRVKSKELKILFSAAFRAKLTLPKKHEQDCLLWCFSCHKIAKLLGVGKAMLVAGNEQLNTFDRYTTVLYHRSKQNQ
jgi:hypothetical protein